MWCQKCHASLGTIVIEGQSSSTAGIASNTSTTASTANSSFGNTVYKRDLLKRTMEAEIVEPWVKCDTCSVWVHQICALFNDRISCALSTNNNNEIHNKYDPRPHSPRIEDGNIMMSMGVEMELCQGSHPEVKEFNSGSSVISVITGSLSSDTKESVVSDVQYNVRECGTTRVSSSSIISGSQSTVTDNLLETDRRNINRCTYDNDLNKKHTDSTSTCTSTHFECPLCKLEKRAKININKFETIRKKQFDQIRLFPVPSATEIIPIKEEATSAVGILSPRLKSASPKYTNINKVKGAMENINNNNKKTKKANNSCATLEVIKPDNVYSKQYSTKHVRIDSSLENMDSKASAKKRKTNLTGRTTEGDSVDHKLKSLKSKHLLVSRDTERKEQLQHQQDQLEAILLEHSTAGVSTTLDRKRSICEIVEDEGDVNLPSLPPVSIVSPCDSDMSAAFSDILPSITEDDDDEEMGEEENQVDNDCALMVSEGNDDLKPVASRLSECSSSMMEMDVNDVGDSPSSVTHKSSDLNNLVSCDDLLDKGNTTATASKCNNTASTCDNDIRSYLLSSSDSQLYNPMQSQWKAASLPKSNLSDFIEIMVKSRLESGGYGSTWSAKENPITIRMLSNIDQQLEVPGVISENTMTSDGMELPTHLPYRQKCILLFQQIDGIDICLFCLYVQEFDSNCPAPNTSRVYIAYLDSVEYFRPMEARTIVYHEIIVAYLQWAQIRGFKHANIWSCPPQRGDNFIFWCHPTSQKTPSRDRLSLWYNKILDRCCELGIVNKIGNLYNDYFQQFDKKNGKDVFPVRSSSRKSMVTTSSSTPTAGTASVMGTNSMIDTNSDQATESVADTSVCSSISANFSAASVDAIAGLTVPICPAIYEGDYWVNEFMRLHRSVQSRLKAAATASAKKQTGSVMIGRSASYNALSNGSAHNDKPSNHRKCREILKSIMNKPISIPFNTPVDAIALNLLDYHEFIKHPMDLGTVRDNLRGGIYPTVYEFVMDIRLTFRNAMLYNPSTHYVHTSAKSLLLEVEQECVEFVKYRFGDLALTDLNDCKYQFSLRHVEHVPEVPPHWLKLLPLGQIHVTLDVPGVAVTSTSEEYSPHVSMRIETYNQSMPNHQNDISQIQHSTFSTPSDENEGVRAVPMNAEEVGTTSTSDSNTIAPISHQVSETSLLSLQLSQSTLLADGMEVVVDAMKCEDNEPKPSTILTIDTTVEEQWEGESLDRLNDLPEDIHSLAETSSVAQSSSCYSTEEHGMQQRCIPMGLLSSHVNGSMDRKEQPILPFNHPPALGYKGVYILMNELAKGAQRLKDDLFVVSFVDNSKLMKVVYDESVNNLEVGSSEEMTAVGLNELNSPRANDSRVEENHLDTTIGTTACNNSNSISTVAAEMPHRRPRGRPPSLTTPSKDSSPIVNTHFETAMSGVKSYTPRRRPGRQPKSSSKSSPSNPSSSGNGTPTGISISDSDSTGRRVLYTENLEFKDIYNYLPTDAYQLIVRVLNNGIDMGENIVMTSHEMGMTVPDPDILLSSPFVDARHTFIEMCQYRHYQFDTLRRAKHSSLLLLYHLHHPFAQHLRPNCCQCNAVIRDVRWHCEICSANGGGGIYSSHGGNSTCGYMDYDICNSCYIQTNNTNDSRHPHILTPYRVTFI